jgi:hypothetical protein
MTPSFKLLLGKKFWIPGKSISIYNPDLKCPIVSSDCDWVEVDVILTMLSMRK